MSINPHKKTYVMKPAEVERKWIVVDASQAPLGRVATFVAERLSGKYQPRYTPHVDSGDYVVVVNASSLKVTGKKMSDKVYHTYSGFPSGLKSATLATKVEKDPAYAVEAAVKGMLPKNKLSSARLLRLKVYSGSEHQHAAQKPEAMEVRR